MSKKTEDALKKYYDSFQPESGVKAYKRGGQMGFKKKRGWGGPNGTTWISEIDQTPVDESFVYDANGQISGLGADYYIRQYWNQHPEEYFKMQGINNDVIANWSSKQQGSSSFEGMSKDDIAKGLAKIGPTLKNFGKEDPTLGKNVNMSTPWSAIAGTAGSFTVDLQNAIDDLIKSKDKHVYNPMHSVGLYANGGNKFDAGGFSSSPLDIAGSFTKILSNAFSQAKLDTDYDTFEDAVNRYSINKLTSLNNINDNDALLNIMNNGMGELSDDLVARDFRNKTVLGDVTNGLASSFEGFNSTGHWAGAAFGGLASNIGSIIGRARASKAAKKGNELVRKVNKDYDSRLLHAGATVDSRNDAMRLYDFYNNPFEYALGGEMRSHGTNWNNGLTFVNAGGSHESNPYEGVPSGVDDEGIPNLVEQGEVIWNNEYVFSDRLKVPEALKKKYKLGGDLTFADAIAKVTKESHERPNDPISNETNRAIVNEFMDEQEAIREKEQRVAAKNLRKAQDEDFMEQLAAAQTQPMMPQAPINLFAQPQVPAEGMPAGFAMGGNKFEKGSWKNYVKESKDDDGQTIYVTSDGRRFYSEKGAQKYIELNQERLISNIPDFEPSPYAMITDTYPEPSVPEGIKVVYNKRIGNGKRTVHHYETSDGRNMGLDLERATIEQNKLNGVPEQSTARPQSQVQQVQQQAAIPAAQRFAHSISPDPLDAAGVTAYRTRRSTSGITVPPPPQDEEETGLPEGIRVVYNKQLPGRPRTVHHYETSDGLNMGADLNKAVAYQTKLNNTRVAAEKAAAVAPKFEDINRFGSVPYGKFNPFLDIQEGTPFGFTSQPEEQIAPAAEVEPPVVPAEDGEEIPKPKGEKDTRARDIENSPQYKGLVESMDRASDEDKKRFVDEINKSLPKGKKVKDYAAWRKGATDGVDGPIHKATQDVVEKYRTINKAQNVKVPDVALNDFDYNIEFPENDIVLDDVQVGPTLLGRSKSGSGVNWERMAPIIGSGIMAAKSIAEGPQYANADAILDAARAIGTPVHIPIQTIGDYRRKKPFDERYLVNMANQNRMAASRGVTNTAGGNRAMDLLGNMSVAYNNQLDLGEIMRQAYLANRQDDAQVAEFNRGTNIQNMNAINQRNLSQAQLNSQRQQAMLNGLARGYGMREDIWRDWRDDRDENITTFLDNLGARGREKMTDNQVLSLAKEMGYNWTYNPGTGEYSFVKPASKGGNKKKRRF